MATKWFYSKFGSRAKADKNALTIARWFHHNTDWTDQAIAGMLGNCYLESLINPAMFQGGQDNPCGIKYKKPSDIGAWSID